MRVSHKSHSLSRDHAPNSTCRQLTTPSSSCPAPPPPPSPAPARKNAQRTSSAPANAPFAARVSATSRRTASSVGWYAVRDAGMSLAASGGRLSGAVSSAPSIARIAAVATRVPCMLRRKSASISTTSGDPSPSDALGASTAGISRRVSVIDCNDGAASAPPLGARVLAASEAGGASEPAASPALAGGVGGSSR
eukprot:297992-Chlamydomonas_euryale.AAC.1